MRKFEHKSAGSFEEAAALIHESSNGAVIAGGTDLIGTMKQAILEKAPDVLVDIKTIAGAEGVCLKEDGYHIGALTKLADIEFDEELKKALPGLAEAARTVATPLIRNKATVGGNICQDVRCWYYRYPQYQGGRFDCARKGGELCYAIMGDDRYHSIFGGKKAGLTPCTAECPAGTDIPGYMNRIRQGDWDGAAEILLRANPMPSLTARVCPHTCQEKCNQCKHGDSVSIHSVERALGDYIMEHVDRFYPAPAKETGKKVSIIGGGPAGLAAAFYLRKAGHAVTIYEKMEEAGGVLMYGIPEYRLPKKYVRAFVSAIEGMGVEFKLQTEVGKAITIEEIEATSDTVFIDTGAWKQPILGLDGENMTRFGLDFLVEVKNFVQKQIDRNVLVCGGGNVAMDVALTAKRLGAEKVTVVCLEQRKEMPATEEEIQRAEEEGVTVINGKGLNRVVYEGDRIKGLEAKECVSVFDENGRFAPKYDEEKLELIEADCIILATGQRVDLDFLGEKFRDEIKSARGLVEVGEHNDTRKPGVYAGGDVASGPSIAIRAIASGRNAAKNMSKYMGFPMEEAAEPFCGKPEFLRYDKARIHVAEADREPDLPVAERSLTVEDTTTLTAEAAAAEAMRCMNCGCYSVNASDLANILLAMDAKVVTTKTVYTAEEFFSKNLRINDTLDRDELVTEVILPKEDGWTSYYKKFRIRNAIDFALAAVAADCRIVGGVIEDIRIAFGGVAPVAFRAYEVEALLKGKKPTPELAVEAGDLAVRDAIPMKNNAYKVEVLRTLVRDYVESLIG